MTSEPRLDHLVRMCDERGLFEHASGSVRRVEHGYCTDDNARLLVVTARERDVGDARRLSRLALEFVLESQAPDGRIRNRVDLDGNWTDRASTNDCWGRAIWGLGVAARRHRDAAVRQWALGAVERSFVRRSTSTRAMAFAVLGACEVAEADPDHRAARAVLADFVDGIPTVVRPRWPWPEKRMSYANAVLPDALIAAGAALGRSVDVDRGLALLRWLVDIQTRDGHLSVVGNAGRGPKDAAPQFDQQPIEVASLADACTRAFELTGDRQWADVVLCAARWFEGDNDAGVPMFDDESGGGFDGLEPSGVNRNQGAESTLALVSTMQHARCVAAAA